MPSQQVTTGPALIEGVERTNTVVVQGSDMRASSRSDPYMMEIDQGRNCYACGSFEHMVCHCRNKGRERTMKGRRVEYGGGRIEEINEHSNNLKGVENLEFLN